MRLSGSDSLGLELSGPVADKNGLVLLCDLSNSFTHGALTASPVRRTKVRAYGVLIMVGDGCIAHLHGE